MDVHTHTRAHRWWQAAGLLAGLAIVVLATLPSAPSPRDRQAAAMFNPLSRVHVDGREWLVVTDRQSGVRTVYEASDGRPLCRLGPAPLDRSRLEACAEGPPAASR